MDTQIVLPVIAVVIAAAAAIFAGLTARSTARQAAASVEQTAIQRQLRIDAAQPYVWVDIRPHDEHAQLLILCVGNSGPTVATNVRVTFDPTIELDGDNNHAREAVEQLRAGIASLPPGRQMIWNLGFPPRQLPNLADGGYRARVEADGPFGPMTPLEYVLDPRALTYNLGVAPGTLHGIAVELQKLTQQFKLSVRSLDGMRSVVGAALDRGPGTDTLG